MHIKTESQKNWEKSFYGGEGLVKGRAAIGFGLPNPEGSPINTTVNLTVPVEASVGEHVHPNQDEIYFVIAGGGKHNTEGKEYPNSQGDVIVTPKGIKHSFKNTGNEPMILQATLIDNK